MQRVLIEPEVKDLQVPLLRTALRCPEGFTLWMVFRLIQLCSGVEEAVPLAELGLIDLHVHRLAVHAVVVLSGILSVRAVWLQRELVVHRVLLM